MSAVHLQMKLDSDGADVVATWLLVGQAAQELRDMFEECLGQPTCTMIYPDPGEHEIAAGREIMSRAIIHSDIEGFEEAFAKQLNKPQQPKPVEEQQQ